jgi:hypothetical protein
MSTYGINVPSPDEHDYHEARQVQRVQAAKQLIDAGDVIAIIESRLASEADPTLHPLYGLIMFFLDRSTAVHGGEFFDAWKTRILAAIDSAIDDALEAMED